MITAVIHRVLGDAPGGTNPLGAPLRCAGLQISAGLPICCRPARANARRSAKNSTFSTLPNSKALQSLAPPSDVGASISLDDVLARAPQQDNPAITPSRNLTGPTARQAQKPFSMRARYASALPRGDDRDLIAAVVAGSEGASGQFIARHDAFFRTVILASSPAAQFFVDDLRQEVYVHLWGHDFRVLRQWQGEYPLRAYLRTVITRLVWQHLRGFQPWREQRTDSPLIEAGVLHVDAVLPATPQQRVCARELVHLLHGALAGLNGEDRRILELRYFDELSYRQIAASVCMTTNATGVRLTRALARLRTALKQSIGHSEGFGLEEFSSQDHCW